MICNINNYYAIILTVGKVTNKRNVANCGIKPQKCLTVSAGK